MKILKYRTKGLVIAAVCLCAIILPACLRTCFAEDSESRIGRYNRLNNNELSIFAPGWVINSTLNQANLSRNIENIQKYNSLEQAINAHRQADKNDNRGIESQLNLQKKRSGADETSATLTTATRTEIPAQESKSASYGLPDIPEPNFITPEKADKIFQDSIKGPVRIAIPDSQNTMNIWQDGNNLVYDIRDGDGNIVRSQDLVYQYYCPNRTVYTYLSGVTYQTDGTLAVDVLDINYGISDMSNYGQGNVYYAITATNTIRFKPVDGYFQRNGETSYLDSTSEYRFNTGDYGGGLVVWYGNGTSRQFPYWGKISPGAPLNNTPPSSTVSFELTTSRTYRQPVMYKRTNLEDAYANIKIKNNNSSSSSTKGKDPTGLNDSRYALNIPRDSGTAAPGDLRDREGPMNNGAYHLMLTTALSLKDTYTFQDLIAAIGNNNKRSGIEDDLLQAANIVMEESAYLDQDTVKAFQEAVLEVVRAVGEMKGVMKEEDFQAISTGLLKLVQERDSIYNDYLKRTRDLYEKLEKLLGMTLNDDNLPEAYIPLYKVNNLARKRIAIDKALEELKSKDERSLSDNEGQALKISQYQLSPLREEYISKLKISVESLVLDLKEIFKDKNPGSASKDESGMNALFLIDHSRSRLVAHPPVEEFIANAR